MRFHRVALAASLLIGQVHVASAADIGRSFAPQGELASVNLPFCENPEVLEQVEDQFEYGAPNMLEADLAILEFRDLFEKAYFPPTEDFPIERRYCQGEVLISTGRKHTLYYVIEYPMGFAAAGAYLGAFSPVKGWKAQGCVLGLDHWHIYGANCQSLRRF